MASTLTLIGEHNIYTERRELDMAILYYGGGQGHAGATITVLSI